MGCCFSSSDYSGRLKPTGNVVSLAGELRQYPLPVTASQVLEFEALSPDSFFVCSSDRLFFDDYVPCLDLEDELEPAEIYFVLPLSKLQHRLAAADVAELAVKASAAINAADPRGRSKKSRISPVLDSPSSSRQQNPSSVESPVRGHCVPRGKSGKFSTRPELGVSRSGSVRKLQRYSSRRAKLAVRSFRMKLTTINEGSVLLS
ncbi:hypothetical protein STAS_12991 [Striga asiatica]|uniref:Uncharacterized protein n=1 Tax=Striga asiatica TaxID=4170 RepID=A0A5A7PVH3_STRAF|nr:hypothetical protein STAS_12991 [Striga asiatica]